MQPNLYVDLYPSDRLQVVFKEVKEGVFDFEKLTTDHIRQHPWHSNCWVLTALASAIINRQYLNNICKAQSEGRGKVFNFQFWDPIFREWKLITIDNKIPHVFKDGKYVPISSEIIGNNICVAIFEKAIAAYLGAYVKLNNGQSSNIVRLFTPDLIQMNIEAKTTEFKRLFSILKLCHQSNYTIEIYTTKDGTSINPNFIPDHSILIKDVTDKYITILNPYGIEQEVSYKDFYKAEFIITISTDIKYIKTSNDPLTVDLILFRRDPNLGACKELNLCVSILFNWVFPWNPILNKYTNTQNSVYLTVREDQYVSIMDIQSITHPEYVRMELFDLNIRDVSKRDDPLGRIGCSNSLDKIVYINTTCTYINIKLSKGTYRLILGASPSKPVIDIGRNRYHRLVIYGKNIDYF